VPGQRLKEERSMKVSIIGTGYVGLVTGVVLAEMGNDVLSCDKDPDKVAKLRQGVPPIYEPGVEEILRRTLADGFFKVTESVAEATKHGDVVFIAVGTPPGPDGAPDLTAVKEVAHEIAKNIDKYTIVVNKSTVPVGSGDMVENIIREHGVPKPLFDVVSNPEFLREGSAVWDTMNPDRIVIGAKNREAAVRLLELYAPLEAPSIITDLNSAELIKYASNSFLALKISFINAVSRVCELCGADVNDVAKGMGTDHRIGRQFLQAGLGWGGSCFPKDVEGLVKVSQHLGYDFEILKAAQAVNQDQVRHFMGRVERRLGSFKKKTVALLGLAFKPNTDDIRDAKSLEIIDILLKGGATVRAFDPVAMDNVKDVFPSVHYVGHVYEAAEEADCLILVTEWNEFRQLDLERVGRSMRSKILFDGRRCFTRQVAERAGFEYYTVGS
jgi:UDPglucose 6-dehydrogenase